MQFKKIVLIIISTYCSAFSQNQGINNNWLSGYFGGFGETNINFFNGNPVISQFNIPMDFRHTHANISDSSGNLLFYTNGYYIADASNDTMQNGNGINPGAYANYVPDGFLIPQAALIIPKPGSNNIYYMFHNTADAYPIIPNNSTSFKFYLTTIDMNLNGGLGAVISKNYILITDSMNAGKITACKHANGVDWWVICHRVNSNKYYKLLVTASGLPTITWQNIGLIRYDDAGQTKFSSDGKRFAYYHYFNGLDLFDFDRCTGNFNFIASDTSLPFIAGNVGCEFSPNSNLLYVSNILKVYQYDLTSANILATKTEVAVWDSFTQPGIPQLGAYLCLSQLAPDGKIYITTGNGTTYMGRISNPDIVGIGCNVAQHSVLLPTYYFNTLPNHPNYFLGCDTTGGCICLVGLPNPEGGAITAGVSPNPTQGIFTLQFPVQSTSGELEVYDMMGNLVHKEYIAPWSQYKHIDITNLPSGIYLCKMKWKHRGGTIKVIKN